MSSDAPRLQRCLTISFAVLTLGLFFSAASVVIFFLGLTSLTMLVTEWFNHGAFSSSLTIIKKPNAEEKKLNEALQQRKARRNNNEKEEESNLKVNASNLTWSNLNYTVPVKGGERRLLHDVFGYCKPGTLTALMVSRL